jgi:hypothetical protein
LVVRNRSTLKQNFVMKFFNPTHRKTFKKCPKRFSYRYIEPGLAEEFDGHGKRHCLYGVRELGGHVVHKTLAEMVRAIADGDHSWNYKSAGDKCVEEFKLIVAKSLATEPGEWNLESEEQLAETFNGVSPGAIKDDVNHWIDSIPTMIENGYGAALELQLGHETSTYRLETEKRVNWARNGDPKHLTMDVVIRTMNGRSDDHIVVVDWKAHAIHEDDEAFHQIRWYLSYFHEVERIPPWKLHGFAVPLTRGKPQEVPFHPHRHIVGSVRPRGFTIPGGGPPRDRYPAKPHPELCVRCPYACMCADALLPTVPSLTV